MHELPLSLIAEVFRAEQSFALQRHRTGSAPVTKAAPCGHREPCTERECVGFRNFGSNKVAFNASLICMYHSWCPKSTIPVDPHWHGRSGRVKPSASLALHLSRSQQRCWWGRQAMSSPQTKTYFEPRKKVMVLQETWTTKECYQYLFLIMSLSCIN